MASVPQLAYAPIPSSFMQMFDVDNVRRCWAIVGSCYRSFCLQFWLMIIRRTSGAFQSASRSKTPSQ